MKIPQRKSMLIAGTEVPCEAGIKPLGSIHPAAGEANYVVAATGPESVDSGVRIGLEGADYQPPWYDNSWLNGPDVHGGAVSSALVSGLVAPQSHIEYRHETPRQYKQSGLGVFRGDLYFYSADSDLCGTLGGINTERTPLYLLTRA
jgi:hypothetical protein